MDKTNDQRSILFYDGECGVCSRLVTLMLRLEKNEQLYYAPLQGATAKSLLPENLTKQLNTAVLISGGNISTKSRAILSALNLARPSLIWACLNIIPPFISDYLYDFFAKNRHHLLKNGHCIIPSASQKARFLS